MLIGIDLGGTKIEGVVLNKQGHIAQRLRVPTPKTDYSATLKSIADLVRQLESEFPKLPGQQAIGVATPGSVSILTGKMKNCNSTCLNDRPLQQDLEQLIKKQVRIANDADCFTLSEAVDGAAKGLPTVFGVILGTGVGGGVCVNQKLLSGPNRIAGEWGHNPMPSTGSRATGQQLTDSGRSCYCGKANCIETYLSGPGFEHSYFLKTGERISAIEIVKRSDAGEQPATQALDQYQELLARALATIINILDPSAIVLGGGLSNIDSLYTEVPARWSRYIFSDTVETRLLPAKFGDSSGVRGAAWLALDRLPQ
jgi:predicted NBD/HSP70 family sugar kinase